MRRSSAKNLALVALCGGMALLAWRAVHRTDAPGGDDSLAFDRVWVEKRADKHTDYVHVMLLLQRAHVGLFERASSYDVHFELGEFSRDKGTVKLVFPQSGAKKDFTVKVAKCNSLPPFDLCLDVSENPWGGPRRYYGFADQEEEGKELGGLAVDARSRASQASTTVTE